jgi:hypothetical protein
MAKDLGIFTLDSAQIDCVPAYKYLGIWIDNTFSIKKNTSLSLNRKQIIQLTVHSR